MENYNDGYGYLLLSFKILLSPLYNKHVTKNRVFCSNQVAIMHLFPQFILLFYKSSPMSQIHVQLFRVLNVITACVVVIILPEDRAQASLNWYTSQRQYRLKFCTLHLQGQTNKSIEQSVESIKEPDSYCWLLQISMPSQGLIVFYMNNFFHYLRIGY